MPEARFNFVRMDFSPSFKAVRFIGRSAVGTAHIRSLKRYLSSYDTSCFFKNSRNCHSIVFFMIRSYGTHLSEFRRCNNGLKSVVTTWLVPTERKGKDLSFLTLLLTPQNKNYPFLHRLCII